MPRLAISLLALALLAGCSRLPSTAPTAVMGGLRAHDADAPVITAVLGDGQAAPTFATWLGRTLTLAVQASSPKGRALRYQWTTDGAFTGPTNGKTVRFVAEAWGDFRATVEVKDAQGATTTRAVKIAVWPGRAAE